MNAVSRKRQAAKKALRTLVGAIVLLVGVITIPYPGPGWLIVFAGLAILARDYPAAQRVLDTARAKYDLWQSWLRRQPGYLKAAFWVATCFVVVITIWLLNGYGFLNALFDLNLDWLDSPLVR